MGRLNKKSLIILIFLLIFSQTLKTENGISIQPDVLEIEQSFVDLPYIDLYFWISNTKNLKLDKLDSSKIEITIDNADKIDPESFELKKFNRTKDGLAFTILMDVSLSMKGDGIESVKAAAKSLVEKMGQKDMAMIITFGSTDSIIQEFTSSKDTLLEKIKNVEAVAKNTVLFRAVDTAFKKNEKTRKGIPKRRAIIVISDGVDEGSGIILDELKSDNMFPVYSIGFNKGKGEFIESLLRLSKISGGQYYHLTKISEASTAFNNIVDFISDQWHIQIKNCDLKNEKGVKSVEFSYLSKQNPSQIKKIKFLSDFSEEEILKECPPPVVVPFYKKVPLWGWFLIGGIILTLLIIFLLLRGKKKKREEEARLLKEAEEKRLEEESKSMDTESDDDSQFEISQVGDTDQNPELEKEDEPEKEIVNITGKISLSMIEGYLKGERVEVDVIDKQVKIGRGGFSTFEVDDFEVSSEHAIITQEENYYYIQDNGSTNGTLVNGIKISAVRKLNKGDIVGIGNTKMRFNGEV